MNTIEQTVLDVIAKEGGIDRGSITLDSTFRDLEIHSLDGIQVIFALEDRLGIDIPNEQVQQATGTVRELIEGVAALVAAKAAVSPQGAR